MLDVRIVDQRHRRAECLRLANLIPNVYGDRLGADARTRAIGWEQAAGRREYTTGDERQHGRDRSHTMRFVDERWCFRRRSGAEFLKVDEIADFNRGACSPACGPLSNQRSVGVSRLRAVSCDYVLACAPGGVAARPPARGHEIVRIEQRGQIIGDRAHVHSAGFRCRRCGPYENSKSEHRTRCAHRRRYFGAAANVSCHDTPNLSAHHANRSLNG